MGSEPVAGPTQTAAKELQTARWQSHPWVSRLVRLAIFLLPLGVSILASLWVSREFPPDRVGLNRWVWWLGLAIGAMFLVRLLERITAKFSPISLLFRLSLIFPDQAPSRFSVALKTGSPRSVKRRLAEIQESGEVFTDEEAYSGQMLELVAVLAEHDRMTRGHAERVRAYSELIGQEMGLSEHDLGRLRWSALLHDMGKLHVPSEILNKEGRPNDEEWAILRDHPAKAEEYLEPLADWLGEWRHAAVGHHERWDGNGYPSGQKGTEIPLSARIVAVADAFDVMTSTRSYKKPMPAELARQEVADKAGSQFDPVVSRAFLNIGLGDLRRTAGPLAFFTNLPIMRGFPIGNAVTTVASSAATAATAAATIAVSAVVGPPEQVPEQIAFVEPAAPTIVAPDLVGNQNENIPGSIIIDGDGPFSVTVIQAPVTGDVSILPGTQTDADGNVPFTYTPDPNDFGSDAFLVQVCDRNGLCTDEEIAVTVAQVAVPPTNDAPVATRDSFTASEDGSIQIDLRDLLANDTDRQGSVLSVATVTTPSNGELVRNANSLTYTPVAGFSGDATFSYSVTDGELESALVPVTITVEPIVQAAAPTTTTTTAAPTTTTAAPTTTTVAPTTIAPTTTVAPPPPATTVAPPPPTVPPNAAPVFIPPGILSVSEGAVVPTLVSNGTIVATDAEGDSITYSIVDLSNTFVIDPDTGEISTAGNLNFETTPIYSVTVIAVDSGSGIQSLLPIQITVVDLNEAPVLAALSIPPIPETTAPNTILGQATATDDDNDTLTYAITGGTGQNVFDIDPNTGEITLNQAVDFETTNSYTIDIEVTDNQTPALTDTQTLTINITDLNEQPVLAPLAPIAIAENTAPNTILGQATATDDDNDTLTYAITGGTGLNVFDIDPDTGEITTTGPLDFETTNIYTIDIEVTDNQTPALTDTKTLTINITDLNEQPVLAPLAPIAIAENTPTGTILGQATATDDDNDTLTYAITGGTGLNLSLIHI